MSQSKDHLVSLEFLFKVLKADVCSWDGLQAYWGGQGNLLSTRVLCFVADKLRYFVQLLRYVPKSSRILLHSMHLHR
jgi:hypothetical protein